MKDTLSKVNSSPKGCELHGHTKITLTNTKNNEVEVIEKDNVVTGLIQGVFNHNLFGGLDLSNKIQPLSRFFSGIRCYNSTISESAIIAPQTNSLIAHAGNDAYSGTAQITRGSYNPTESGVVTGGYNFVWDWTTSQGNGTINSVCLTGATSGQLGDACTEADQLVLFNAGTISSGDFKPSFPENTSFRNCQIFDWASGKAYSLNNTTANGTFVITEFDINTSAISLLDNGYFKPFTDGTAHSISASTLTAGWSFNTGSTSFDGTYLYYFQVTNNSANIRYMKINVLDWTQTDGQLTYAGAKFAVTSFSTLQFYKDKFPLIDGYLYVPSYTGNSLYKCNIANTTDITLLETTATATINSGNNACIVLENGAILGMDYMMLNNRVYDHTPFMNATTRATFNSTGTTGTGKLMSANYLGSGLYLLRYNGQYTSDIAGTFLAMPQGYLSTVNNLANPLTKTNDKTMKIEYTITES